jgi:N6-L-threonylcarbamoyladenine synthase
MKILAIETSCDETALAIVESKELLSTEFKLSNYLLAEVLSSQTALHALYGGVVPELAAREHLQNFSPLLATLLERSGIALNQIEAVAVTQGPGLKGCLLVGLQFGSGLASGLGVPLIPIHHLEGHLWSGLLLEKEQRIQTPFIALLVSGGHTLLVLVEEFRSYKIIASTRDDAAGEAFDKIATLLSLPYPGGPALSKLAISGNRIKYPFPIAMVDDPTSFSFSGLKTAVSREIQSIKQRSNDDLSEHVRADLAASVEHTIAKTLCDKTILACQKYAVKSMLLTGGVAANSYLRAELQEKLNKIGVQLIVAEPRWCTDNAVMIANVGSILVEKGLYEKSVRFKARPDWPITELASNSI